jgi:hypothetical protein
MKNRLLLVAFTISSFLYVSCTKEDSLEATDSSQVVASASIDAINELDVQTGTQISFTKLTGRNTEKSLTSLCGTITMEPATAFPKTFYIDFGTACTTNGITRKGKLKITFSNYITETNSTMTIERQDYSVNNNKVEGTIVYQNITTTAEPQWTRTVTNGKFTDSKGDVYLNAGTHTVKQTAGALTPADLTDNIYEMTAGTHTVTKQNGAKITLTITEPLIKNFTCDYVSKGKLRVESTLMNGTIDYGTGDCDNQGTYTQNGIVFPITM